METTGMPWQTANAVGGYGERMAARYLTDLGLEVLDRNWRCELGEIDIVARDGTCLVVCEVKTRRSTTFGDPVEAVDHRKLARLRRLAGAWLAEHSAHSAHFAHPAHPAHPAVVTRGWAEEVRVDVIGILRPRRGPCRIEHLVGVLS
ncbi:YraN family protein [Lapillicoccus sp.]|uniref:YraN family protein n=1 Tax=Lapillicoccus sp. TaxID=1909287 RepID=UPI003263C74D